MKKINVKKLYDDFADLGWDYTCNRMSRSAMECYDAIAHYDSDVYTWGDGDSLDRERVRDIMNQIYDGGYNPFAYLEEVAA